MGWFVPVLTTIGSGSAAAGGAIVATAVAGAASAYQTYQAGSAEASALKQASRAEQDSARGREIERKRNLLAALANQRATAGAQGVAFEGGKEAIARKDILYAREDAMTDRANTDLKRRSLRDAASNAKKAGAMKAGISLLDTASKVANMATI